MIGIVRKRIAQLGLALALLLPAAASIAAVNLSIQNSGPATVVAGTDLLYNITVSNIDVSPATGVTVTDVFSVPVPGEGGSGATNCADTINNDSDSDTDAADAQCFMGGLIYVGATESCSLTAATSSQGTVTCNLGALAAGSSINFTIKFHVSPDYLARVGLGITNTATVSAAEPDPEPGNDTDTVQTSVDEVADLKVTVFAEPADAVYAGQTMWYTIYVDNFGPSVARSVKIMDTLLSSGNVSIQSCAFSVSQGGGAITQFTCTTGNLVQTQFGTDAGTFATNYLDPLTPRTSGRLRGNFRLVATTAMDVTHSTRTTSDTPDPDTANNQVASTTKVTPVADLQTFAVFSAEVQVNGQQGTIIDPYATLPPMPQTPNYNYGGTNVTAGRRIEFTATTINAGPSPASNVVVKYLLPAGTSLLPGTLIASAPGGAGTTKSGRCYTEPAGEPRTTVICEYGTLYSQSDTDHPNNNQRSAAASFQVQVDENVPHGTRLSIDALVRSEEFDSDLSNNVVSLQFTVNNWADLQIHKFAVGTPIAGSPIHYELQVSNKGPSTADGVRLQDFLPNGITYVSAYIGAEGTGIASPLSCTVASGSNVLFCPLGAIPPSLNVPTLVFVNGLINSNIAAGTHLINAASLLSNASDPYTSDNNASVDVTVQTNADLELTKTAADIIAPSTAITFTLTVNNKGPSDALNVVVTDTMPSIKLATYVSDSGGCVRSGTTLTCSVGTVKSGESKSFNVYMLPKGSKGFVTNTASVTSSTADAVLGNNNASKSVLIKGGRASK